MGRALKSVTGFLTSARVAIGVMVVITLLAFIGASLPQGADREAYLEAYGGTWGGLAWRLGLTDVFKTQYFSGLLVLLCIMVLACALKSLPRRVRLATRREYIAEETRLRGMTQSGEVLLDVDPEEATLHVRDICRRRFYSVSSKTADGATLLYGSKMGYSRYGSFILHISFIFLLVGAVTTTRLGSRYFRESPVGDQFVLPVSGDKEITVMVDDFNVEVDEADHIKDFICDVALVRADSIFMKYSIRPNHPLKYGGREVYLQSYSEGMAGLVTSVYDSRGNVVVPHLYLDMERPVYVEELEASARLDLGMVPMVRLAFDDGTLKSYMIRETFERHPEEKYQFVVMYVVPSFIVYLEVVKEPFQGFIYAGLALLTVGTFVSLYLSHRRMWFKVSPAEGGRATVVFGGRSNRNRAGFNSEFDAIRGTLNELT